MDFFYTDFRDVHVEMLESIFLSRWGGYIVMLAILGLIVLLLRGLFGPRGLFRDPYWDKRNKEIRAEEAAAREARRKRWQEKYGLPEDKAAPTDHERKGSDEH